MYQKSYVQSLSISRRVVLLSLYNIYIFSYMLHPLYNLDGIRFISPRTRVRILYIRIVVYTSRNVAGVNEFEKRDGGMKDGA